MKNITALFLFVCACGAHAQTFATQVASSSGLGKNPLYNDPSAMLGRPTLWNRDTFGGGPLERVATSIGYGPWGTDDLGNNVVTSIPAGGQVTLAFDNPILDDPLNWFGMDFTVYGNSSFLTNAFIEWNTNLENVLITGPEVFAEPMQVSVSPDLVNWYTYTSTFADDLFPTQAFNWDFVNSGWGAEADWTKPVDPSLTGEDFDGLSVADGIALYQGSAGGTSFDLAESGFGSIRYIRFNGSGGEIDGVSRVGHVVPEPASWIALGFLTLGVLRFKKRA